MHTCDYLGTTFEVRNSNGSWFWRVCDSGRNGGTIGVAGNEADAVRDACLSIEEAGCAPARADLICATVLEWERSLGSLARYLVRESGIPRTATNSEDRL
jgi:hypothetical protein